MIEILTSDSAILVFSCLGLAVTALSIVRDARPQREDAPVRRVPVRFSSSEAGAGPTDIAA